ncbi:hypothetical protein Rumeso_02257 [Rubellimicrobium mesophilum DSM 19309]|uniref:Uncharacterized protein n=1 Tax=Rubellimicrobium mesophilum DSM 19309 TaxID=442562 RepID=A0A017HNW0_9RHOB|nr:hypothetical protein [Rubellimicrobium mesophilum]EYD76182.1 hypothetical protein Rumeso_02257 [Rubellimicrobium mesophilum DSM 19309]
MRALSLLFILLAVPALAQGVELVTEVRADLDEDGVQETYTLRENGDLVVSEAGWERVVSDAAFVGPVAGQQPSLGISVLGSVLLTSMNEGLGRDRRSMTLTIAHRQGDWRIAGYNYDFYDPMDPDTWGHCDLNLLTGEGVAETNEGPLAPVAPSAPPLWNWRASELPLPMGNICFDGRVVP